MRHVDASQAMLGNKDKMKKKEKSENDRTLNHRIEAIECYISKDSHKNKSRRCPHQFHPGGHHRPILLPLWAFNKECEDYVVFGTIYSLSAKLSFDAGMDDSLQHRQLP